MEMEEVHSGLLSFLKERALFERKDAERMFDLAERKLRTVDKKVRGFIWKGLTNIVSGQFDDFLEIYGDSLCCLIEKDLEKEGQSLEMINSVRKTKGDKFVKKYFGKIKQVKAVLEINR